MPTHLLFLAAAAQGEAAGAITKLFSSFGVDLPFIIAQAISFCIVAWVLWRFAFKPVLATMEERKQQIESGIRYAEEMKHKLEQAQQQSQEIIKQAQLEGQKAVDEARNAAKDYLARQTKEAVEKANDIAVKAQQAIELEHRKMLADARTEIARLVVATTQRVLARELSDADRGRYNEAAARELTQV